MNNIKRAIVVTVLAVIAAIFWFVPDPLPMVDELIVTLFTLGGIGKQIRCITMKNNN